MNRRRESKALKQIWDKASPPPIGNKLSGTWCIEMATGILPALKCHRKSIWYTGLFNLGHNVIGFNWGEFKVYEKQGYSVLEYTRWPIKDEIKQVAEGLLLGKFYWRSKFRGYFWMTRVIDDGKE